MPVLGVCSIFMYPKSLLKAIRYAAEMGFRHINIFAFPPHFKENSESFIRRVRDALFEYGLECSLKIQGYTINPAATNPNLRRKSVEEIKYWLSIAEKIGCSSIVMRVGMFFYSERVFKSKAFQTLIENLRPIVEKANSEGIRIFAENYPYPFDVAVLPTDIIKLSRALKQKVYLALNIAHLYDVYKARGLNIDAELDAVRSYIKMVYFSEYMNPWDYPHKLNDEYHQKYLSFLLNILKKMRRYIGTILIIGFSPEDVENAKKILRTNGIV